MNGLSVAGMAIGASNPRLQTELPAAAAMTRSMSPVLFRPSSSLGYLAPLPKRGAGASTA